MGVIHLGKLDGHALKLKRIFERTVQLVDEYKPDEVSLEAPFYGKNVQSMLKLGRAQGVAMAAALYRDVPIFEYTPKKIKKSITGNGNASKVQVAAMLQSLFDIKSMPKHLDATDGLAAAACHFLLAVDCLLYSLAACCLFTCCLQFVASVSAVCKEMEKKAALTLPSKGKARTR